MYNVGPTHGARNKKDGHAWVDQRFIHRKFAATFGGPLDSR